MINPTHVEVYSAVPLSQEQLRALEIKLARMLGRRADIAAQVDPSLLGGVRVVAGDTVYDDTIKRKLSDMKRSIYEGMRGDARGKT